MDISLNITNLISVSGSDSFRLRAAQRRIFEGRYSAPAVYNKSAYVTLDVYEEFFTVGIKENRFQTVEGDSILLLKMKKAGFRQ